MFPVKFNQQIRLVTKIKRSELTPYHMKTLGSVCYKAGALTFSDKSWSAIFLGAGEEKAVYCICDHQNRVFALEVIDEKHYLNGRFIDGEYYFATKISGLTGQKFNPESLLGLTFTGLVKGREFVYGYEWSRFQFNPNHKSPWDGLLTFILRAALRSIFDKYRARYGDVHERNIMFEVRDIREKGVPILAKDAKGKLHLYKVGIQAIDVR